MFCSCFSIEKRRKMFLNGNIIGRLELVLWKSLIATIDLSSFSIAICDNPKAWTNITKILTCNICSFFIPSWPPSTIYNNQKAWNDLTKIFNCNIYSLFLPGWSPSMLMPGGMRRPSEGFHLACRKVTQECWVMLWKEPTRRVSSWGLCGMP